MKNKTPTAHPNQEDKSGKPTYASTTRVNSSTNKTTKPDVILPRGVESEYKDRLLKSKKRTGKRSSQGAEQ